MKLTESQIQSQCMLDLSAAGARIFRNTVGKAIPCPQCGCKPKHTFSYGLCPGSSDLIGWTSVTVTPDMVGQRLAVFTAVEVKRPGARTSKKRKEQQRDFIDAVNRAGGRAGVARSSREALAIAGLPDHTTGLPDQGETR